ncbi:MAG: methyltransferase type 11 [Planctomycetota bacterium]|nr:MAG: methyltransferase type 11 [Planctomycetota bacterium]
MQNGSDSTAKHSPYGSNYDNFARFISYFYQIDLVRSLKPKNLLEVGIGNKTVSNYLKDRNMAVTTCDIDSGLNPDYIADIRKLPFEDNSYDVVMACEIIEHLPWDQLDEILTELHRVTSKYVLISVPYLSIYFELAIKFPMFNKIFNKPCIDLFFRVPFVRFKKFSKSHCWEIGTRGCSLKRLRSQMENHFQIEKEVRPILNPKHYFFVLTKI